MKHNRIFILFFTILLMFGHDPIFCTNSINLSNSIFQNLKNKKPKISRKAKKYFYKAYDFIAKNALYRDSVNLDKIKSEAFALINGAKTYKDVHPAIHFILKSLNDGHSFLLPKDIVQSTKNKTITDIEYSTGKIINNIIGYIQMPGYQGNAVTSQKFADSLQTIIKLIDTNEIKGWIIDLRKNIGGSCYPMLTGIGPILGNGIAGYFISKNEVSSWYYENGSSGIIKNNKKTELCKVTNFYTLKNPNLPIAILTNKSTASSGEVVVTSFRGRENTRSFGQPTCGLSTGNIGYPLDDGSMIILTVSVYADRNNYKYGKKIVPDQVVIESEESLIDATLEEAITWITKKK